jgi:MYXO-CTERM domain-containing protein
MPAVIKPSLVGISSSSVTVKVINSDFVKETPQHLEMVLPSVFDLVTPLLGNLPDIQVPTFAGFSLSNLSIQKVTTSQDQFLALYASLGAGFQARQLAVSDPFARDAVAALDAEDKPMGPPSKGTARLVRVDTPSAERVRGALLQQKDGKLPSITFDVDRFDTSGRELEWTWNFNGGLWHEYSSASPLVISDRAFAWQGKYTIGLKSRVKGDYQTVGDVIETPVVIDSVGPRVFDDKAEWKNDQLIVPVWDVVSGKDVQVAYGRPGTDKPLTDWVYQGDASLARASFDKLQVDGNIVMFARDEVGNVSQVLIAPFHGQSGAAGCACDAGNGPGVGGIALLGVIGFVVLRRRRKIAPRTLRVMATCSLWLGASAVMSLNPGCDCNHKGGSCETAADCGECPKGQLPFCIDNVCVCSDDVPLGHVGPYSDVATGPDGTIWVSAYAQSHGDLVVAQATGGRIPDEAWEWVDGVPDGPVVVPDSKIRGGIADDGPDVGMYTSIAVGADGTPMVSYFDVDRGALKLAQKIQGVWVITDVDVGAGSVDNIGGSAVGMYSSISLRSDDSRPGIAYLAHVNDASGLHAEVRYASAQTTTPTGPGDWQTWVVDTGMVPDRDNIYPLPDGLGLFVDSTRNPTNQAPVVAYYDRGTGDLKVSKFNVSAGSFAAAVVLDGSNNTDVGWSPSIQVDAQGVVNVAYVSATSDDLKFITEGGQPEVIDDGYRIVGTTVDGLPKPEFHFVGDDAGLVLSGSGAYVVYQDSTTQELLLATRQPMGGWMHESIAGATQPWPGAYGFFAADAMRPTDIVMSTWVIDQPTGENWVEVFTKPVVIQ